MIFSFCMTIYVYIHCSIYKQLSHLPGIDRYMDMDMEADTTADMHVQIPQW